MEEIRIGEKLYISSKRAAEVTGYAKDYVGQLCREGHVEARMVGRSWYVLEQSIRKHRFGESNEEEVLEQPDNNEPDEQTIVVQSAPVVENMEVSVAISLDQGESGENEPARVDQSWEKPSYKPEPVYTIPEVSQLMQQGVRNIATKPVNALERTEYRHLAEEASLTEMQKAWKEWFETRGQISQSHDATQNSNPQKPFEIEADSNESEDEPENTHATEIPEQGSSSSEFAVPLKRINKEQNRAQEVIREAPAKAQFSSETEARIIEERITRRNKGEHNTVPGAATPRSQRKMRSTRGAGKLRAALSAAFVAIAMVVVSTALVSSGLLDSYLRTSAAQGPLSGIIEALSGEKQVRKSNI